MLENRAIRRYERRITPIERLFTHSPYSTVSMVARIRGTVSENMLWNALTKVRQRHPNLRVRIIEDEDGQPWFTSEGAGEISVQVVPREAEDSWISVVQASCQIPYDFEVRPAIRFILVQSPTTSDLVILCHHLLCDGLSLAYLARDLMVHLGDPAREVELLPDPVPITIDNMPQALSVNPIVRFLIRRLNRKWEAEKMIFDQQDYLELNHAYWTHFRHRMLPVELSKAQTLALVHRCRENEVTVNSALSAAFLGAQSAVQGARRHQASIGIAASLRDRLQHPAGEGMGFFAGVATLNYRYDGNRGFWDSARRFHQKVRPLLTDKILFADPLLWCYLEPSILEAINFKKLGGLVPEDSPRHEKLAAFAAQDDTVLAVLKRDKMESLDTITMGTAVTNLGRLDLPSQYGALELERLIMKPGGAFPLVNVNLVLGAATCAGRLSLLVEYVEENVESATMEKIRESALGFLLGEQDLREGA